MTLLNLLLLMSAAQAGALPLEDAARLALQRNPGLEAGRRGVQAYEAQAAAAGASRLPSLRANAAALRGDDPVYAFGSRLRHADFTAADFAVAKLNAPGPRNDLSFALEAGMPLFSAFAIQGAQAQAEHRARAVRHQVAGGEQELRFAAAELYLKALGADAALNALDRRIDAAGKDLEQAERLRGKGFVLGSDHEAARAVFAGLQMRRVEAERTASGARRGLALLLEQDTVAIEGALPAAPPADSELSGAVPAVQAAQASADAAEQAAKTQSRSILPSAQLFASLNWNSDDLNKTPRHSLIGVQASLPFGDPTYLKRREAASAAAQAARAQVRSAAQQAAAARIAADEAYEGSLQAAALAAEMLGRADASLTRFRPLFREGRQSILEVLRAEDAAAQAELALIRSRLEGSIAWTRRHLAAGTLDEAALRRLSAALNRESDR